MMPDPLFFRLSRRPAALAAVCVAATALLAPTIGRGEPADSPPAAGAVETAPKPAAPERIDLLTSDGVELAAWYYAVAKDEKPRGTVILVHDLEGSHASVEPLAAGLQRAGYAVVAPDLRGHGDSTKLEAGGTTTDAKSLRKNDLLAIAASAGGRVRDQASMRGDLEAVRNWIKRQTDDDGPDINRLCVVGCGAGGTLAALWTVADYAWQPTTSGPQGRQVRGLAVISPVWTVKGVTLQPALKADALRREVPILVVSGKNDRDGLRLVEQFKGLRPKEWFTQEPGKKPETAEGLAAPTDATIFSVQLDTPLSADKLAADESTNAAEVVATFLGIALE